MKRTEILCPECMKQVLIYRAHPDVFCDGCGTEFTVVDQNTVRYK